MKKLFKNGTVVNVFTDELIKTNVLIDDGLIIGVGAYTDEDANITEDISGLYICPGFIDSHIHIESSMLTPFEFARVALPHGTTAVIADPHEIANVMGKTGLEYMLKASEGLPLDVFLALPSCVPATPFDEAGAELNVADIEEFYSNDRVVALGEVMNYVGVIAEDTDLLNKINSALNNKKVVNGHAPLLSGKELDKYIRVGISDDHECSSFTEAKERIQKGQHVLIREGTAAKNLKSLIDLFEPPYSYRCLLSTDDRHPADMYNEGHIDHIIRSAAKLGKSAVCGIRMATIQAAEYYGLKNRGAVAPGYIADLVTIDNLENLNIVDVYKSGRKVVDSKKPADFEKPAVPNDILQAARNSFHMENVSPENFEIARSDKAKCRVIELLGNQIITNDGIYEIDFSQNNGVSIKNDILKIAVVERHKNTGHIGLGFIKGLGMKKGAIASSVSHDSHNLIVIGTDSNDMAFAANRIKELGGGLVVANKNEILAEMPLPIAGLMSEKTSREASYENEQVRRSVKLLGISEGIEPFMHMAFTALPVIPHLRLTTMGLVDVNKQETVSLII